MIFVIGSGPAGVSCAAALLARGLSVTMLDASVGLEEDKKKVLEKTKNDWNTLLPNEPPIELTHPLDSTNPIKWVYGSNFPYAEVEQHFTIKSTDKNIHCLPSFARGGLSNAWGAFSFPYNEGDLSEWSIKSNQLEPYYKKIFTFLNCATATSFDSKFNNTYQTSSQANFLLSHLTANTEQLAQQGIQFGTAQLAVKFNHTTAINCSYCGKCQHGCPAELIYSSSHTLTDLLKNSKLKYIPDIVVDSFNDTDQSITIYAHHRVTKKNLVFSGSQVFCACGPIISTALFLKSVKAYQHKTKFYDSSHFMLPLLLHKRIKNITQERLHTLCQLYLKLDNPTISANPIHLQIYTYMDHYLHQMQQLFKYGYRIASPFLNQFIDRMVVIQGYLHSSESHAFTMKINNDNKAIELTSLLNSNVNTTIKILLRYLMTHRNILGMTPISLMRKVSRVGKSFHYGGSLPMRTQPREFETDIYGKPTGCKRLHIVDATIFPTIPAGSMTPTIMANAYRIGSECNIYE
jgi:choline dehydrogenase-like flavoprotein